jgi:hypothetical protein
VPANIALLPSITRRSAYSGEAMPGPASSQGSERQKVCGKDLASCKDIQPPIDLFPRFELKSATGLAVALIAAAVAILLMLCHPRVRRAAHDEVSLIAIALVACLPRGRGGGMVA